MSNCTRYDERKFCIIEHHSLWLMQQFLGSSLHYTGEERVRLGHGLFLGSADFYSMYVGPSTASESESQMQELKAEIELRG